MKKVILFFANGTEECEALLVVDLLRRAGAQVTIAAVCETGKEITSSHDITLIADANVQDICYTDADMIVLPGGMPGTTALAENAIVIAAVQEFMANNKLVAAICAAPSILAPLGLLEGRTATAHAAFQNQLGGATVQDAEVVIDKNLITSYGLGGAIPFALCLVSKLFGADSAAQIQSAIAYRHKIN